MHLQEPGREKYFAPPVAPQDRMRAQNTEAGSELLFDVDLPPQLQPNPPTSGSGAMQFYQLDNETGVLALGSFSGTYSVLETGLLEGLLDLRNRGATKLVVDLTNNGGGYICIANWLHRLIAGSSPKSEPLAGLNTTIRATPIARKIVDKISNEKADPQDRLSYNPLGRKFANNSYIPEFYNWYVTLIMSSATVDQYALPGSLRVSRGSLTAARTHSATRKCASHNDFLDTHTLQHWR